ncbi:hypothetical protein QAD02_024176 [Eretmocerus hayati]|uniref:Uncharacterized protein n=1 Tax=Eretmocerus hayati TaxID=131215 RepID=A0ACC2PZQ2_9HYME|nr:hypothetical protein QAD02_024176 [Eretmocerus hayati]
MTTTIARHASKKTSRSINPTLSLFGNHTDGDFDQTTNYGLLYAEENSVIEGIGHFEHFVRICQQESTVISPRHSRFNTEKSSHVSHNTPRPDPEKLDKTKSEGSEGDNSPKYYNSSHSDNFTKDKLSGFKRTQRHTDLMESTNKTSEYQNIETESSTPDEDSDEKCDDERIEKVINVTPSQSPVEPYEKDEANKMMTLYCGDRDSEHDPLIFSRSSSLGSLSGYEQQAVDVYGDSVANNFSHQTSDFVPPNEITDSTALLMPSNSFCNRDGKFVKKRSFQKSDPESNTSAQELLTNSIFEDEIAIFKEESTPIEFQSVAASSLSSLTIEDDECSTKHDLAASRGKARNMIARGPHSISNALDFDDAARKNRCQDALMEKVNYFCVDEEKILDEYVRKGIAKVTKRRADELSSADSRIQDEHESKGLQWKDSTEDACHSGNVASFLDENSDLTVEEEELLDECIRRGIAKVTRQNLNDVAPVSLRNNFSKVDQNKCEPNRCESDDENEVKIS